MTRVRMLVGTYDSYHGLLRRGDEKNVPQDTAERWEKNHIAAIIEPEIPVAPVAKKEKKTSEKAPKITFKAYEGAEAEALDKDPVDEGVAPEEAEEEAGEVSDEASEEAPEDPKEAAVDYSTMTRDELVTLANSRGIMITKATKVETIIKKLEA